MKSDYWTTIGEVADIFDGPHATPKKINKGPIFLGIASLNRGSLDLSKSAHVSEEDFVKWTRRVTPKEGDVVFSYETRLGEAAIIPKGIKCCLGRRMGLLRPKPEKIIPEYLLFYYLSPIFQAEIKARTTHGSTVDRILLTDLGNFPIYVPPKQEQKRIIKLPVDINRKLEINSQINQTLEQIAQAIFKSWFIDFDPVKAKIAAKQAGAIPDQIERAAMCAISGKTEEQLAQLPPATQQQLKTTAALFPDSLVDSDLDKIPEGWDCKPLDKIAHYQNGLALQKYRPENENEFLPVLKIAQLKKGYANGEEKASSKIKPECIVDNGDVVFSWSGSLIVDIWCGGRVALNQHLFKVTSRTYPKWFYYFWTRYHLEEFQRIAADKAVTMGHIKRSHLEEAQCAIPDSSLLNTDIVGRILEKQIINRIENSTLEELRDTLLPKLLSGELEV